jgi:ATP-dependent Lon protease
MVQHSSRAADNVLQVVVQTIERCRIRQWITATPYLQAGICIATANQLETIPEPLRDPMEVIQIDGYTEQEKVYIAQDYLVPRQLRANGLHPGQLTFTEAVLRLIVRSYAREAGVRNLERQHGAICHKVAVQVAAHAVMQVEVTPALVRAYLEHEPFASEVAEPCTLPGITTDLAVTGVAMGVELTIAKSIEHLALPLNTT